MKYEEMTFTVRFKTFEVGEKVMPTSPRCPLEMGKVYTVTKCKRPLNGGDPCVVEGREAGISTEYLSCTE
jgi:hypothetical protein